METIRVKIGEPEIRLNGKPFCVEVDTFSHEDWFGGYFKTNEEAVSYAEKNGGQMYKIHAYDKDGRHIGEGGEF